jgi:hypothetical protein
VNDEQSQNQLLEQAANTKSRNNLAECAKGLAGKQTRRGHKDLVPEFKEVRNFSDTLPAQIEAVNKEDPPRPRHCGRTLLGNVGKILDNEPEQGDNGSRNKGTVGVYWTHVEFTRMATSCAHPLDEVIKVLQKFCPSD